jgi:predicted phosphodiesterase
MVISLIAVVIPRAPTPTPTPFPTWTPPILATSTPNPSLTPEPTEAPVGPQLPTDTPVVTPTVTLTPTPAAQASESPTATPAAFRFAVCGDSRDGPGIYRRVLEAVVAQGAEFLIHTGDLVNEGTEKQWQAFQKLMAGFALPFYPVPGNHDGLNGKLDGYLAYSGAPAAHYSFDRGEIHFTLADSHNGGISAAELQWLREDLDATDRPIKMVFLHHPPFDPDGTDHVMAYGNRAFMDLMAEMAVDYVFAGHIHAYARQERDGVVYLITGGAGAPLYGGDHPLAFHHFLSIAVQGQEVAVDVVEL